jgi:hypothetical protein
MSLEVESGVVGFVTPWSHTAIQRNQVLCHYKRLVVRLKKEGTQRGSGRIRKKC